MELSDQAYIARFKELIVVHKTFVTEPGNNIPCIGQITGAGFHKTHDGFIIIVESFYKIDNVIIFHPEDIMQRILFISGVDSGTKRKSLRPEKQIFTTLLNEVINLPVKNK